MASEGKKGWEWSGLVDEERLRREGGEVRLPVRNASKNVKNKQACQYQSKERWIREGKRTWQGKGYSIQLSLKSKSP